MNPHFAHSSNLLKLVLSLWAQRYLLWQLTRREVIGRYRGSALGLLWSFFNPILMLAVYTFVFSVVFKMKWGIGGDQSNSQFALVLFVGIILHSFLAECLNRAPSLISSNVNYVKRVVFPLEILPIITLGAALFHTMISFSVLMLALVFLQGGLHWTVILVPVVILPFIILLLGLTWFLAAIGVYLRDIGHVISMLVMALLFLAPIFFPLAMIPEHLQPWMFFNPLTLMVEQARSVIILGVMPNWSHWLIYFFLSLLTMFFGFMTFQKSRKGFADVL